MYEMLISNKNIEINYNQNEINLLEQQIPVVNVVLNHKQQRHYSKLNRHLIIKINYLLFTFIVAKALLSTLV